MTSSSAGILLRAKKLLDETVSGQKFQTALTNDPVVVEYLAKDSRALLEGQHPKEITDFRNTGAILKDAETVKRYTAEGTLKRLFVFVSCAALLDSPYVRHSEPWHDYVRSRFEMDG